MAEAVGLVLGVVGIIGTFKSCVDLLALFSSNSSFGRDHQILDTKLHVQKALLLQWAKRVRLVHPDYDKRLDDPTTQSTISRILAGIQQLLSESTVLEKRYGLRAASSSSSLPLRLESGIDGMTSARMDRFNRHFQQLKLDITENGKAISASKKMRWVIADKDKFEKLVQELSDFVSGLNQLVPETSETKLSSTSKFMAIKDVSQLDDAKSLALIYDATFDNQGHMAQVAAEKLDDLHTQEILDTLWFHSLDHRRYAVTTAHDETFQWALEHTTGSESQDEEVKWDDLRYWLEFENGIYWISGKAGSGKSTLMKYLYHHKTTSALLSKWAGLTPLSIGSFFFWNLGTPEQKSLSGLLRAILHQILSVERYLVPELLPTMWQDAQRRERTRLNVPTDAELNYAIEILCSDNILSRSFCFLIDGLDEFDGDYHRGASLVQRLAQNSRVKIVVSSRPIPSCVVAFSKFPKLRLQDLTRGDIAAYIQSTIGSHPYMEHLAASNDAPTQYIVDQLMEKASGVFLWVILACRSVVEGFAACDNIHELRRRIDELPKELEDLFKHMLKRIEPRYHGQMAKMLKIRHQKQDTGIEHTGIAHSVHFLPWAMLDDFDLDLKKSRLLEVPLPEARSAMCRVAEGRLRSRCGGLLEIKPCLRKLCQCGSDQINKHDTVVDSTVEFIHRTMAEFLDNPETWELACLRIEDAAFDANAALSVISLQMAEITLQSNFKYESQLSTFTEDAIIYASRADKAMGNEGLVVLSILRGISKVIPQSTPRIQDVHISPLILAVEARMINCVKYLLKSSGDSHCGLPLLHHALCRPGSRSKYGMRCCREMIHTLLLEGCQPNEQFKDEDGADTTPWQEWLQELNFASGFETIAHSLNIIKELIKFGANLDPPDLEPIDKIIKGHLKNIHDKYGRQNLDRAKRVIKYVEDIRKIRSGKTYASKIPPKEKVKKRKRQTPEEQDDDDELQPSSLKQARVV
ncbi:prion-inhibition and propagation-domain-containing protein [Xylaria venustula]|nr:prion-inhibition and propagation-domain-containing protein [Xylaria venustula]